MSQPINTGRRYRQGIFTPKHPEKYRGDSTRIRYMSSWELEMHNFLDNNPNVVEWSSEEIAIPYIKPTDGRIHRYYPDYLVTYKTRTGQLITELIEVKPKSQTKQPRKTHKHALYEQATYAINIAKWQAATKFANDRGWIFRIVTENSIFR